MDIEKFKQIFSGLDRAYGQYLSGDLKNGKQEGHHRFQSILETMDEFKTVEFDFGDIIRSGLVRNYLIAKTNFGAANP